uniref:Uncharacterized protein n=1 Tax=Oryza glumipatula TaxID=40148 RepID=A0A0E0BDR8_9ORYZ
MASGNIGTRQWPVESISFEATKTKASANRVKNRPKTSTLRPISKLVRPSKPTATLEIRAT